MEMTKQTKTRRAQGIKPMSITDSCQCCMSTVDIAIVPVGIGHFTMSLCPECQGAKYKIAQRSDNSGMFKSAIVAWLDCPTHGEQLPMDVENHHIYQKVSKKTGKPYDVLKIKSKKSGKGIWGFYTYNLKG